MVPSETYSTNFIRQAVCELRFPTLFELEGPRPPAAFARAMRKEYPHQDVIQSVNLGPGQMSQSNSHTFKSKGRHWSVSLRSSAVVLETTRYTTFFDFRARLDSLLRAASEVIDSDFFTRVGLRYINVLPYMHSDAGYWVNEALVAPMVEGVYGDVSEFSQRIAGVTPVGGYLMQHGALPNDVGLSTEYSLDYDLFSEEVSLIDTLAIVDRLHELEFSLFMWSLGPVAREHLKTTSEKVGHE